MVVRVRWRTREFDDPLRLQNLGLIMAALLAPSALLAFTMAFWIIASDLKWTSDFFLSRGIFSHWQVWLGTAAVLLSISRLLNRFARSKLNGSFSEERFS